jgi:hypothetical protein
VVPGVIDGLQVTEGGGWTVLSNGNRSGSFVDPNPPADRAFYRVALDEEG